MERYLNMKFKNLIGFCVARVSKLHGFVADFYKTSYFYYGKFSAKFLYFLVRQIFQNVTVSSKSSVPTHGLFQITIDSSHKKCYSMSGHWESVRNRLYSPELGLVPFNVCVYMLRRDMHFYYIS